MFKHVRCNPDVLPRLTSGGYDDEVDVLTPTHILFIGGGILIPDEDKVGVISPNQHIVHTGLRILIPHEDKLNVITPVNILFIGVGEF